MSTLDLTSHAIQRLAQRGISATDIDLILAIGSEAEGGFIVCRKDCDALEREVKQFLQRVRRLEGKRVVLRENKVVTAYHATENKRRQIRRSSREGP